MSLWASWPQASGLWHPSQAPPLPLGGTASNLRRWWPGSPATGIAASDWVNHMSRTKAARFHAKPEQLLRKGMQARSQWHCKCRTLMAMQLLSCLCRQADIAPGQCASACAGLCHSSTQGPTATPPVYLQPGGLDDLLTALLLRDVELVRDLIALAGYLGSPDVQPQVPECGCLHAEPRSCQDLQ